MRDAGEYISKEQVDVIEEQLSDDKIEDLLKQAIADELDEAREEKTRNLSATVSTRACSALLVKAIELVQVRKELGREEVLRT